MERSAAFAPRGHSVRLETLAGETFATFVSLGAQRNDLASMTRRVLPLRSDGDDMGLE